ncbi:hypothetical protein O3M35_000310 [Rhynocoris fuscipes]|uniref:Multiple coagulation factor deficiency protein 2 n=1 Tax=Rhynocoris fuscipes TaxID=488301 RepID=A0AAW1DR42_9HEMI
MSHMHLIWYFLPIVGVISIRGPHHPKGHHHYKPKADGPKLTQDSQLLHDVEHIQDDLAGTLPDDAAEKMTPEELEFHYFKLHDFDHNTKLDGLEILHAIRHSLGHDDDHENSTSAQIESSTYYKKPTPAQDFAFFVDLIDHVLLEDDTDRDGYLSYVEYAIGRQRDLKMKAELSKQYGG